MKPKEGESKKDFINRFMNEMSKDYPDEKQCMSEAVKCWKEYESEMKMSKDDSNEVWFKQGKEWTYTTTEDEFSLDKATDELKATEKDQWIKVLPVGEHYIEKYGKKLNFDAGMFGAIKQAFNSPKLSKPFIDKNHEKKESYGWIKELKEKSDGLFAKIKLNPSGLSMVKDEVFKYVSPWVTSVKDLDGTQYPYKLRSITLTNEPALEGELPELQAQLSLDKNNIGGYQMELEKLATELSLSKDSSIEIILEAVSKLKAEKTEAENKAIELSKQITEAQTEKLNVEAKDFVKKQIELGKMHPAIQDIVLSRYVKDKETVIAEYDLIPEALSKKEAKKIDSDVQLTKEEEARAEKAGFDLSKDEDYKAAVKHIKAAKQRMGGK